MPYRRNSLKSRKAKSAARAAQYRENLGLQEGEPINHFMEEAAPVNMEKEIEEVDALIAAIDELLAGNQPSMEELGQQDTAEQKESQNGSDQPSMPTGDAVDNRREEEPSSSLQHIEEESDCQMTIQDDDFYLQLYVLDEDLIPM